MQKAKSARMNMTKKGDIFRKLVFKFSANDGKNWNLGAIGLPTELVIKGIYINIRRK